MPQDITKADVSVGNIVYQWNVPEYERWERPRRWYIVMGVLAVALIVYAVFTANYLFALIIVLFGIILYLHDMQEPMQVPFVITDTGIILGRKYYRYSEVTNFWLIYNPPDVKNLYFSLDTIVNHRLQIPLLEYDPRPIRNYLSQFIAEDLEQEEEPMSDRLARLFRFH